jgi:hypothetical protein
MASSNEKLMWYTIIGLIIFWIIAIPTVIKSSNNQ